MKLRRMLAGVLSVCMLAAVPVLPVYADDTPLRGDVNSDGTVDVKDAVLTARIVGMDDGIAADILENAAALSDFNGNGTPDADDLTVLLKYLAGLGDLSGESALQLNARSLTEAVTREETSGLRTDEEFRDSQLRFTANLIKEAQAENEMHENLLLSPLSAGLALTMTANGAKGDTRTEMEQVLGNSISVEKLNQYYLTMENRMKTDGTLDIANSIWMRDDPGRLVVPEEFLANAVNYYNAEAFAAPFDDGTLTDINGWVNDKTHGMIPKTLNEISPDAIMYLINALAFEGKWETPFSEDATDMHLFTPEFGEAHEVEMMYSSDETYIETDDAIGFSKPYKGNQYSFIAVLPKDGVTPEDYIAELDAQKLQNLIGGAQWEYSANIALPKFKYDYSIILNGALCNMGMPTAFNPVFADFTGLNSVPDAHTYIDFVLQKTFIDVNEEGTRAAAVTVVATNDCMAAAPQVEKDVILDRPFLYMIMDNGSDLPVFIGTVSDITA